uniref:Methyltransferase FkbM domain-containing protein n=1 Tax=Graphocephala atropunctata TaxID=36148 RepID=A0A1B6KJ09_9HEMI
MNMYQSKIFWSRPTLKGFKIWIIISICCVLLIAGTFLTSESGTKVFDWQSRLPPTPSDSFDGEQIAMDNPKVIKKLLTHFLLPPPKSGPKHVYYLTSPETQDTSMGQSEKIRNILHDRKDGFFIECGALDGETRSNTLYMERFLNWSGLLIEADPLNFGQMLRKNRRTWLSPTCLSKTPYPQIVSFKQDFNIGRISDSEVGQQRDGFVDVQCFPIYSYLLALNVTHVDYFSLDVEGDELEVLKTIPFDKVDIETLSVEFAHVPDGKEALQEFMITKGYSVVAEVTHPQWLANDFIFVKNKI